MIHHLERESKKVPYGIPDAKMDHGALRGFPEQGGKYILQAIVLMIGQVIPSNDKQEGHATQNMLPGK